MAAECGVCYEPYAREGDHCPKLLPCSHTVCLRCLQQLGQGFYARCPECRKMHRVPTQGVSCFPTNRYILDNLALIERTAELQATNEQRVPLVDGSSSNDVFLCDIHGKPCVLYCTEARCRKRLCPACPIQNHTRHNLIAISQDHRTSSNDQDLCSDPLEGYTAEVHNHDFGGDGEVSFTEGDTISETEEDIARSIGDGLARVAGTTGEVPSAPLDDANDDVDAYDDTEQITDNDDGEDDVGGLTSERDSTTVCIEDDTLPEHITEDSIVTRDLNETEQDLVSANQVVKEEKSNRGCRKGTVKCLRLSGVGLGYCLGVICIVIIGVFVVIGIIVVYVIYLVCCILYHICDGLCKICSSEKPCCFCIDDIKTRFKRCKERIESVLTKCKAGIKLCFQRCGGCNGGVLSVVYSIVLYFVLGVIAVVGIVSTGAILVAGVTVVISVTVVVCCLCRMLEKR